MLPPSARTKSRPVRRDNTFLLAWGSGYGGIPLVILVILTFAMGPPWDDWLLNQRAEVTRATPYKIEATSSSINDQAVMRVRVRFEDGNRKEHEAAIETVDGSLLSLAARSEPMPVEYDPENPSRVRFQGHYASALNETGMVFMIPLFLLVFVIPGLGAFFFGVFRAVVDRMRGAV